MLLHLRDIERLVTSHVVKNLKFISCSNIICSRDITIIDHAITITGFNYDLEAISYGYGSLFTSPFSFTGVSTTVIMMDCIQTDSADSGFSQK